MNIVLITDDFYPNLGGIANVLGNLYKFFQFEEHELYIFNPFSKGKNLYNILNKTQYSLKHLLAFLKKKNFYSYTFFSFWKILLDNKISFSHRIKLILYLILKPKILLKTIENIDKLYPYLKKLKFDVLVAGNSGWILPLVFILSRIFKKKIISIAYGNDFLILSRLSLKTYYFRAVDKIIVITDQMKKVIQKMHNLSQHHVEKINVGINAKDLEVKTSKKDLRIKYGIDQDTFVILSVGRQVPRKRFDLVIKAINQIKSLKPYVNLKYYLIGEGRETQKLIELTKKFKLENIVEFFGTCDLQKRNEFYKLSDLFIMPSETKKNNIEGFGIVFLEANYHKVPVIGSATGGMLEAIINGETGYLIKPNDIQDLIDKILFLYNNRAKSEEMGEIGYKRVINQFLWDKIVKIYVQVFKSV